MSGFVVTIKDVLGFTPSLTTATNGSHSDQTDVYLNGVTLQNFLQKGLFWRFRVIQPTTSLTLTNQLTGANNFIPGGDGYSDNYAGYLWPNVNGQTTGYVGGPNGILIATVQGSSQASTNLQWRFEFQQSPTGANNTTPGGDWTTVAEATGAFTMEFNSTNTNPAVATSNNYVISVVKASNGNEPFLTASTTPVTAGGPTSGSVTIDGLAVNITGTAALASVDYQLTIADETTTDSTNVDNFGSATISQVATYDACALGNAMNFLGGTYVRGTPEIFFLNGSAATWTTVGMRAYTLDGVASGSLGFQNTQVAPYAIPGTGSGGTAASYTISTGFESGAPFIRINFGGLSQNHTINSLTLAPN